MTKRPSGPRPVRKFYAYSEEGNDDAGMFLHSVCFGIPNDYRDEDHKCIVQVRGDTREDAKYYAELLAKNLNRILIESGVIS